MDRDGTEPQVVDINHKSHIYNSMIIFVDTVVSLTHHHKTFSCERINVT